MLPAFVALVLHSWLAVSPLQRPVRLRYDIRRNDDSLPGIDIRLTLDATRDSIVAFQLPNEWAGRRELYRQLEGLRVEGAHVSLEAGASPDRVIVHRRANTPVTLTWHLRGTATPQFTGDSQNHDEITARWAQLIGYDALVIPDMARERPVDATFTFGPDGPGVTSSRRVVATSFGSAHGGTGSVRARVPLGELWHAMYLVGASDSAVRLHESRVRGRSVSIAIRDSLSIPDSAFVRVVGRVVGMERNFWSDAGPAHYLVSIGAASQGTTAGTRLSNAFIANMDRGLRLDSRVIELFSHELMHEWIGGAIHSGPGVPENQLLWFTEGFTDFLNHRLLWRSGLISDSGYVAKVNALLQEHALSAAGASPWKDVMAGYWTNYEDKREPYLRGELLALRLSALSPPGSLAGVLRSLLTKSRHGFLLTDSSIVAVLAPLYGRQVAEREISAATGGGPIALPATLMGGCATSTKRDIPLFDPGFDIDSTVKTRTLTGVRPGGAAERAGLRNGMKVGGMSIYRGDAAKDISLQARVDTVMQRFVFRPVGDRHVEAQAFTLPPGCRLAMP